MRRYPQRTRMTGPGRVLAYGESSDMPAQDWLLPFEFLCGMTAVAESSPRQFFLANGRSTSKLDFCCHRRRIPRSATAVDRGWQPTTGTKSCATG